ncbi:hypothetical protein [Geomonas azotofigens]|uniref:hypothetical protein n=1 Tax=Geomonas azotofigens TaxID=2843196 RepID=UPI001C100492|nr:hypothetical protein [Geomonas azotofigens]MBU5614220.1 hypothetical protein [Geomonas azotofigens]
MYRDLEDFWHFSRRYRIFQRVSSLSHPLLERDHELSERAREALDRLNRDRIACQGRIVALNLPGFARCFDCRGACCREPSERYFTAIDYWLRRHTPHEVRDFATRSAPPLHRYYGARLASAWRLATARPSPPAPASATDSRCGHLGERGCLLPAEQRPLKCLFYACSGMRKALDEPTRRAYIEGVKDLQRISILTFDVLKLEAGVPSHYGAASLLLTL